MRSSSSSRRPLPACPPQDQITREAVEASAPGGANPAALAIENLDAIRQAATKFAEAFNRGDAKAIADLWTHNGEYIDEQGRNAVGREAIENDYAEFFAAKILRQSSVCWWTPCVFERRRGHGGRSGHLRTVGGRHSDKQQLLRCPRQSRWAMADGLCANAHVPNGTAHENITDLEWLIGTCPPRSRA